MNKTVSIGLAGYSFTIDELAYVKLEDYLKALQRSMEPQEVTEVMHDIELRIVEILKECMGNREVVNTEDVEAVIKQIGTPEQIDEQGQEYSSESGSANKRDGKGYKKQLFRDPATKKIGGVSGGLAQFLDVDVIWIRLAFIILLFARAFGLLLYIILWIVMPLARTTSDFLKMKGEPQNFDNIKEQSNRNLRFVTDTGESESPYQAQSGSDFGNILVRLLAIFVGVFTAIFALSFFFSSLAVLFGTYSFTSGDGLTSYNLLDYLNFYLGGSKLLSAVLIFLGFLSLFIPAVIFTLLTVKLFNPKSKIKYLGYLSIALVLCWFLTAGILAYRFKASTPQYSGYSEETQDFAIQTTSDTLWVEADKVKIPSGFKPYIGDVYSDKVSIYKPADNYVKIEKEDSLKTPYLSVTRSAKGRNYPLDLKLPVQIDNNRILLPDYMQYPYKYQRRHYRADYELHIPAGMIIQTKGKVRLGGDTDKEDRSYENTEEHAIINIKTDKGEHVIVTNNKISIRDPKKKKDTTLQTADEVTISVEDGKPKIIIKSSDEK